MSSIPLSLSILILQTLMLVGVIPFVAELNSEFVTGPNGDNEILAIRVGTVVVFLVGMSQLVLWTVALLTKSVIPIC